MSEWDAKESWDRHMQLAKAEMLENIPRVVSLLFLIGLYFLWRLVSDA